MLGKTTHPNQLDAFRPQLDTLLFNQHELVRLAEEVDWRWIEDQLADYYAETARPSVPTRTMVGMLLLKHLFNESDESVLDRWVENPYRPATRWQYFTSEQPSWRDSSNIKSLLIVVTFPSSADVLGKKVWKRS